MITFDERKTVYFDVDDTLLEWKTCDKKDSKAIKFDHNGHDFYKRPIMPNIEALKLHFLAGHLVVVWSAGGARWAEKVIRTLCLHKHVNLIINKPDYMYDDKDPSHWMPNRQFKENK